MRILAYDFGASSGRAMLAEYDGHKIVMKEIHRFPNNPIITDDHIFWNTDELFGEIMTGMKKAVEEGGFDSIGIDTWGVDYGLIDKDGKLIQTPYNYRDKRTSNTPEEVFKIISKEELYSRTGIQLMHFNTIFQLFAEDKQLLKKTDKMLLIPDLFNYMLSGEMKTEYTNATTTQMINAETKSWDLELCKKLGIPDEILPELINSGEVYGMLKEDIANELGITPVPIISVPSHDTAAAIVSVPSSEKDFIYISCGTWSLFGTELDGPIINEKSQNYNITNEGGHNNTITFLKNIMGLWLIQETRRQFAREGIDIGFSQMDKETSRAKPYMCFIDPDSPEFEAPGDLPSRVKEYCRRTNQYVPQTRGEVTRCINESLAFTYRRTLEQISDTTGKTYNTLHMIGGGTQSKVLCQMTADACNIEVKAGPVEATVLGNIAVQLIAAGEIKDTAHARKIISDSFPLDTYHPNTSDETEAAYKRFLQNCNK